MAPIVQQLAHLVESNGWRGRFDEAIAGAVALEVVELRHVQSYDDYLRFLDGLVSWAPRERGDSRRVSDRLAQFYFFLDREPLRSLQSPIRPGEGAQALTPLSAWIVAFADAWGDFLDTHASVGAIDSFRDDPVFNWHEYMPPPSGYQTFNQFFARHTKPGMRPVAAPADDAILVAPADSTFVGWWQVGQRSEVYVQPDRLSIKGVEWSIHQLLEGSEFADRFRGGVFTHSFLDTFDYHRWHSPVRGKVVEARVLQGQAGLDVTTATTLVDGVARTVLSTVDGTGYQFVQTRGLVVIESPVGLVACLPMGMAQVSSVVITAEVGVTLRKGEELGYFQFGGSDFVLVFERASNVHLTSRPGVHAQQGTCIGQAFPV